MAIVNVNSFESRVDNENFLTTYTNEYLKQSLANLGQRLSVKGDSITSASFKIKDLFDKYLASFSKQNLVAEFRYDPSGNSIKGQLMELLEGGKRKPLEVVNNTNRGASANSIITIDNTNGVITPNQDTYPSNFLLQNELGINGSKYWHRDGSVIAKVFDKDNNTEAVLFKVTGHANAGTKGEYDNEYICDEISTRGEFISGFRICMTNEMNLMINDSSTDKDDKYENLVLLWLHKNPNYIKDSKLGGLNSHPWLLTCYKSNVEKIDLGDFKDIDVDVATIIKDAFNDNGTLSIADIVKNFTNPLTEIGVKITSSTIPLFSTVYNLGVDYDSTSNVFWSIPDDQVLTVKNYELCINPNDQDHIWKNADNNDIDFIRTKLQYFAADKTQLFPLIQSIYDEIVYHDSDNLKLKKQIIASLVKECYNEYIKSEGADKLGVYDVLMPIDLTIKYNGNSNDSSIIYNTVSSISVQFLPIGTDENGANDIYDILSTISNNYDDNDNLIANKQLVVANGVETRSALYDLSIEYINNDTIIDSINWYQAFQLPYVSSEGYWIINGINSKISAKPSSSNASGLVLVSSGIKNTNFVPSEDLLFSSNNDFLSQLDWELQEFSTNYIDENGNIGDKAPFKMQAYVPSSYSISKYAESPLLSYLTNSLFMVMSSVKQEADNHNTNIVYTTNNDATKEYNNKYKDLDNYYLGTKDGDSKPTYIYKVDYKEDSLAHILGTDAVITSFWKCEKEIKDQKTTYKMSYIRKPNNSNIALDIPFMASFEKYIKHYANATFSPDNYKHRWLVFDSVNTALKNNTLDNEENIYPLIRNYDSTYFQKVGTDPSRSLKGDDSTEYQYQNDLNLSIEFTNHIAKDKNGNITNTNNTLDSKKFEVAQYITSYNQSTSYIDIDSNGVPFISQKIEQIKQKYGYIPYSIPYTYFDKELIPNSIYDANSNAKRNVYPLLNLKEVLVHNINTLNRNNVISIGKEKLDENDPISVLYYAYFGVPFDSKDKSHLKIGTASIDPNLGTTTMTSYDSIKRMTPMKSVDVEFSYINLSGDTFVSGNLTTDKIQWKRHVIDEGNGNVLVTYSTIAQPVGLLKEKNINPDDGNDYGVDYPLLSELHFKTEDNNYQYKSRYYKNLNQLGHNSDIWRSVSYLNVNQLLKDNGVAFDEHSYFYGDATVLTKREGQNTNDDNFKAKLILSKFAREQYGAFCDFVRYMKDPDTSKNMDDIKQLNWYNLLVNVFVDNQKLVDNYLTDTDKLNRFIVDVLDPQLKYDNDGIFTSWQVPQNSTKLTSCYLAQYQIDKDEIGYTYFDMSKPYEISSVYTLVPDNKAPKYDTASMKLTYNNWFLELSTDLCNKENLQFDNSVWKGHESESRKLVVSNPIEISYTDIYSYDFINYVPKYKKVYSYMFVDGSQPMDYTVRYNEEKQAIEYQGNKANYAYNEVWTCTGCDKCSENTCKLIGICKHSNVHGSFKPSYGFFILDENDNRLKAENLQAKLQEYADKHVYRYEHHRQMENDDGTAYEYISYSYYPLQTYKEFFGNADQRINNMNMFDKQGNKLYYDWKGALVTYIPGAVNSEPATYIPIGHNILCTYDYVFVNENNKLNIGNNVTYSISKTNSQVTYTVTNDKESTIYPVSVTWDEYYTYINGSSIKELENDQATPININYKTTGTENASFSYMELRTGEDVKVVASLTKRHINVRELTTNHSEPQYMNGNASNGLPNFDDDVYKHAMSPAPDSEMERTDVKHKGDNGHTSSTTTPITIVDIKDKQVKLTFTANKDTSVDVYFTKESYDNKKPDDTISLTANKEKITIYDRENIYTFVLDKKNLETYDDNSAITSAKIEGALLNCRDLFYGGYYLTSLDLTKFDTSKVTNMSGMFQHCSSLISLDLSNFNTSNVTDMSYMFNGCSALTSLDLSNFNTSKVTIMENMFAYCDKLTSLDVTNFDTSKVIDMSYMFCYSALTTLDVSHFNTLNVNDMYFMFGECESLIALDLTNFNTSNVTNMCYMFYGCSSLTSLDITNFDINKVTKMINMFSGCSRLTTIGAVDTASGWQHKPDEYDDMFDSCPATPKPTWY